MMHIGKQQLIQLNAVWGSMVSWVRYRFTVDKKTKYQHPWYIVLGDEQEVLPFLKGLGADLMRVSSGYQVWQYHNNYWLWSQHEQQGIRFLKQVLRKHRLYNPVQSVLLLAGYSEDYQPLRRLLQQSFISQLQKLISHDLIVSLHLIFEDNNPSCNLCMFREEWCATGLAHLYNQKIQRYLLDMLSRANLTDKDLYQLLMQGQQLQAKTDWLHNLFELSSNHEYHSKLVNMISISNRLPGEDELLKKTYKNSMAKACRQECTTQSSSPGKLSRWCSPWYFVGYLSLIGMVILMSNHFLSYRHEILRHWRVVKQAVPKQLKHAEKLSYFLQLYRAGLNSALYLQYGRYYQLMPLRGHGLLPEFYFRSLTANMQSMLLPDLRLQLQKNLESNLTNLKKSRNPGTILALFINLKNYLILSIPMPLAIKGIAAQLAPVWSQLLSDKHVNKKQLVVLLHALLVSCADNLNARFPIEKHLIEKSRYVIQQLPLSQQWYLSVLARFWHQLPAIHSTEILGDSLASLWQSHSTLPGVFAPGTWHKVLQPWLKHWLANYGNYDWVRQRSFAELRGLSDYSGSRTRLSKPMREKIIHEVYSLYKKDARRGWQTFITSWELREPYSWFDADSMFLALNKRSTSMVTLLKKIKHLASELQFSDGQAPHQGIEKNTIKKLVVQLQHFTKAMRDNIRHSEASYNQLITLLTQANANSELLDYAQGIKKLNLSQTLPGMDNLYNDILLAPLKALWLLLSRDGLTWLSESWQLNLGDWYQRVLAQTFPFFPESKYAADPMQVQYFFSEKGLYKKFFQEKLEPLLQLQDLTLIPKTWLGWPVAFSKPALYFINQATTLSDSVLSTKGFSYELLPVPDPALREISWHSGHSHASYRNGPKQRMHFHWRLSPANDRVSLQITDVHKQISRLVGEGHWGLLRLLQQADWQAQGMRTAKLRFSVPQTTKHTKFVALNWYSQVPERLFNGLLHQGLPWPGSLFYKQELAITS